MQQTPIIWPRFENTYLNRAKFLEKPAFEVLQKYTLIQPQALKALWNGPGRFYHNWDHARFLMGLAAEMKPYIQADCDFDHLILAILFHDAIYVPGSKLNELMSAEIFKGCVKPEVDALTFHKIYCAIIGTDYGSNLHVYDEMRNEEPIAWWLQQLDLYQLIHAREFDLRDDALINFIKVWCEFEHVLNPSRDWAKIPEAKRTFENGQNVFLTALAAKFNFYYEPITWSEIERSELQRDVVDLADLT